MPDGLYQQKLIPYDGSQDSTKNPILIKPTDIVDSNNIVFTTYSTKKLRPGIATAFANVQAQGRRILGVVDFWRLGVQRVVYYDGISLFSINPLSGVVEDIAGGHVIPVDEAITFTVLQGLLLIFFQDSVTPIKYWTQSGTIQNLTPDARAAPFGTIFLNSLWIPDVANPGRMLKSASGQPDVFTDPTTDAAQSDLDVGDGDPVGITAIFPPFYGSLYVSKRFSVYRLTPVTLSDGVSIAYQQSKISDGFGALNHNSVVAYENNIAFPSDWGWHTFQSTNKLSAIDTDLLSKDIQPVWVNDTNFNRSKYIQAGYDRSLNSIICLYPSGSSNFDTDVWGFSIVAKKWYRWRDYNHSALCPYIETQTNRMRTLVGSNDGKFGIIDQTSNTDYGKRFGCSILSGIIAPSGTIDDNFCFNYLGALFVPQGGGSFNITYKLNGQTIDTLNFPMVDTSLGDLLGKSFVLSQSILGGVPQVKFDKMSMQGNGMVYQLLIEFDPSESDLENVNFELLGLIVDVATSTKSVGERVA